MSEFIWYTRLAVLVGAVVVFAQALSGRGQSILTFLAVLAMSIGLILFVAALAREGLASSRAVVQERESNEPQKESVVEDTEAMAFEAENKAAEVVDQISAPSASPEIESIVEPVATATNTRRGPVTVTRFDTGEPVGSQFCPLCAQSIAAGEIVASCPQCGAFHHVGCWVGHRFHCAREGCDGWGSLEAPNAATDGAEEGPSRGPSKP